MLLGSRAPLTPRSTILWLRLDQGRSVERWKRADGHLRCRKQPNVAVPNGNDGVGPRVQEGMELFRLDDAVLVLLPLPQWVNGYLRVGDRREQPSGRE